MTLRTFDYAADFVSTDQFRIERNACSLGLLPGFSLECAVPDTLFLGPVPSRYRAYGEGVVSRDRTDEFAIRFLDRRRASLPASAGWAEAG
ncbi:MAG: hypothetical protein QOH35_1715 [Acidobacteriaceae bacterium]|jgi:hypothetical protein|nr:hypothetical protein [Acidobacteriaceae bacterium]